MWLPKTDIRLKFNPVVIPGMTLSGMSVETGCRQNIRQPVREFHPLPMQIQANAMLPQKYPHAITPREIVFHLTNKCPLRCSHCCTGSGMDRDGTHLSATQIAGVINDLQRFPQISRVSFAGGEPFLHPEILARGVRNASENHYDTTVVTSGFWASRSGAAVTALAPLAAAGLKKLNLSFDDAHSRFVSQQNIVNVCRAAREFDILVALKIAVDNRSEIDKPYMEKLLDANQVPLEMVRIDEYATVSTGRGKGDMARPKVPQTYLGPCRSALRQFSVYYDGTIVPCCGAIPLPEKLATGNIGDPMDRAIHQAFASQITKWLAFEGPVEILKQITADTDAPLGDTDFDGICHACDMLQKNTEYWTLLNTCLPEKTRSLEAQEMVYTKVGNYLPPQPVN